jgi:hypothetical protein
MKRSATVFALLALLTVILPIQSMAQTPPAPTSLPSVDEFLGNLSNSLSTASATVVGNQVPSPTPMATSCTSSSNCPSGQLCCYPCGIDGCTRVCMKPMNGHCPFFP